MTQKFTTPALAGTVAAVLAAAPASAQEGTSPLMCEPGETYIMNVTGSNHSLIN